jgi:hypothetical protein
MVLEFNENENIFHLDTAKVVQRRKLIAMSAYIKKTERSQINDQMLHLRLLEKQEQAKLKQADKKK